MKRIPKNKSQHFKVLISSAYTVRYTFDMCAKLQSKPLSHKKR